MNNKIHLVIFFSFSILLSCKKEKKNLWVGDIEKNIKIDNPDFKLCNGELKVFQYFNVGNGPVYNGEKSTLLKEFYLKYNPISDASQNGLIRIRFIVNCRGEAGRFRILQSNLNYEEIEFDKKIVSQLLKITKGIKKWEILKFKKNPVDYYMYLIFKIKDGRITEILP